jgi:hypothetical protein
VYLGATAGGAASSVARLNEWTLDMATPFADATAFGDANQQYSAGIPNCQGTFKGLWDDTDDAMYDASRVTGALNMYLYPSSLVLTKYFYGTAHVSFEGTGAAINDTVAVSAAFAAASDWGQY